MSTEKKKGLALHWKIIIGMVLGIIWAYLSIKFDWNQFTKDWVTPFGTIFIRLLKFIAIPLVLFSIIVGVSSLKDVTKLGRVGLKTLGVYLVTTFMAVTVGLVFVNMAGPGKVVSEDQLVENRINYELWVESEPEVEFKDDLSYSQMPQYAHITDSLDERRNRPDSLLTAEELEEKEMLEEKMASAKATKDAGPLQMLVDVVPDNIIVSLQNPKLMLQVIFFAIFFGVTMLFIPEDKAKPVQRFFEGINEVFLKMVDVIMRAAPFFVFALMAGVLSKMSNSIDGLMEILYSLGAYSLVVIGGLLFMILLYPLLVSIFVKRIKYTEFWCKISPAQLMAFSTSSSAATLPVTMECVEEEVGVKPEVSSFVLPIGATVNMDGTSLYQAVAVIFLAQIHLIDLTLADQIIIVVTATLASIGSAAVPGAGMVMLVIVLQAVGKFTPEEIAIGLTLIFAVDRPLDMLRTTVNVTGDATVSMLVAKSMGKLGEPKVQNWDDYTENISHEDEERKKLS